MSIAANSAAGSSPLGSGAPAGADQVIGMGRASPLAMFLPFVGSIIGETLGRLMIGETLGRLMIGETLGRLMIGETLGRLLIGETLGRLLIGETLGRLLIGETLGRPMIGETLDIVVPNFQRKK